MSEINRVATKSLTTRYSIGRTALYDRFKVANVKPQLEGRYSWVTGDEIRELDRLHNHLLSGGTLEGFISELGDRLLDDANEQFANGSPNTSIASSGNFDINRLIIALEDIALRLKPGESLAHLKQLEQAADAGWLLTSREIRDLIGVKPQCKKGDRSFVRGTFRFVRVGKIGNQSAWQVVKLDILDVVN